jgi:hypothetical protein
MQLFVTSHDATECAAYLCNRRLNKQILECAQLLSTALYIHGCITPYKPTHVRHPITKWVASSIETYELTKWFFVACCAEYYIRYRKQHGCAKLLSLFHHAECNKFPRTGCVARPYNCTPYKDLEVTEAYKKLLNDKWMQDKIAARCSIGGN